MHPPSIYSVDLFSILQIICLMTNTPTNKNKKEKIMNAYGIVRVSTIGQEENTSIQFQTEKLTQYATLNNLHLKKGLHNRQTDHPQEHQS